MPRSSQRAEGIVACRGSYRIRKRLIPPSSSSSSSVVRTCRLKQAIFVPRRGGLSTPYPEWKMDSSSSSSSSSTMGGGSEFSHQPPSRGSAREREGPVSARKLANALWELVEMPSPVPRGQLQRKRSKKEPRRKERVGSSVHSGSLPPHLSDPSHSPVSEVVNRSCSGLHRRKTQFRNSHKPRSSGYNVGTMDFASCRGLMEQLDAHSRGYTPTSSCRETRSHLKDLRKGLSASKEFLKIVDHFCGLEKHHHSYIASIFSALSTELERATKLVEQLMKEQRQDTIGTNHLCRWQMEGNATLRQSEHEQMQEGFQLLLKEHEIEKKLRRRTERQNEKLGMELAETKAALSRTRHALESEKRSREAIEHVCNELVRGIGEDKAEVEEMKLESVKVREELEREREMLQLADTWREERVHMKLTEAKFQLEEKNAAVDQLRSELEVFLEQKRSRDNPIHDIRDLGFELNKMIAADRETRKKSSEDGDEVGSVDSSDLHSIELNMDNISKGYRWSFAKGNVLQDIRASVSGDDEQGMMGVSNYKRSNWSLDDQDVPSDLQGSSEFGKPVGL